MLVLDGRLVAMADLIVSPREIAVAALSIAEGYAAAQVHEEGGNNRGDQVEFFQRLLGGSRGDPRCADFVCTCLVKGYARAHGLAEDFGTPGRDYEQQNPCDDDRPVVSAKRA